MFCQHCGKSIADGSGFCTFCGGRQSPVASPISGASPAALMDEVFTDVSEVAEDVRWGDFSPGRVLHLRPTIESGGPYGLLVCDEDANEVRSFDSVVSGTTLDLVVPRDGHIGFAFWSHGGPGVVRLRVD